MKTLGVGTAGRNHWVTRFYSMLTALAVAAGAVSMLAALGGIRTAGAHAGSSNPAEVHACVNNFGHVRIVDASRECLPAETPLHWAVGGDSTAVRRVVVENSRVPVQAQLANPFRGDREVTLMTRNVYVGANLIRPVNATNFAELVAAVTTTFAIVQATNFQERAEALASEVEAIQPDLIGLQEVVLWRSQFPADFQPTPNATTVEYDFLQILLDALAARGLRYAPVAVSTGADSEAPRITPQGLQDIRLTGRDVILARADLKTADLKLSNIVEGHFVTNAVLNTVVGPLVFRRGWAAVDAKIRGRTFRFITTHLETQDFPAVQLAQARELLQGPASTDLPVILLGDFNSRADGTGTATYATLRAAGFDDTWSIVRSGDPGFTCCQSEDLRNPVSGLGRRIDLILFRGDFEIVDADVVGEEPADRTASGLWPSDHAGVGATLELPGPHR